ncbi:uncharacterized protein SCHCODRAFT_02228150 [Schizophyllum commune H4-8]|uniref:uncharacterized protein n=1 Tax=Schizophyllum commune (strain H4-8 / FGSC 9210) TaxID=578458 RepID=UPI00215EAFDC|nr:uncharacterized protein SCHCODRAFT_02228150 [Schizophyllum commune H4-8]KAI5895319.1 hypothetical protein SCHCODRAFT_02228150 [Schizophyllum commune H4-8]
MPGSLHGFSRHLLTFPRTYTTYMPSFPSSIFYFFIFRSDDMTRRSLRMDGRAGYSRRILVPRNS